MKKRNENKELQEKVEKYKRLTQAALKKVSFKVEKGSKEFDIAMDFFDMAERYYADGKYYMEKGDLLTALASFSYAHAWLDAGVRAHFFDAQGDDQLFTLP
jgi:hypothetical protein